LGTLTAVKHNTEVTHFTKESSVKLSSTSLLHAWVWVQFISPLFLQFQGKHIQRKAQINTTARIWVEKAQRNLRKIRCSITPMLIGYSDRNKTQSVQIHLQGHTGWYYWNMYVYSIKWMGMRNK
jgi:hypothetical protein